MFRSDLQSVLRPLPLMILTVALGLSGCGQAAAGVSPSGAPMGSLPSSVGGTVHGGQSPIQDALVTLYVTSTTASGYGQPAIIVGTGTTDVNGGFTISPSATPSNCPSGQQAYITAAGGYPSGSPSLANTGLLLMVALGDCSGVNSSTYVNINEVTTVAAAYALSGFMTTSYNTANSVFEADVSAPSASNTAAASVSSTAAAGLAHAFLNAANLVSYSSGMPNSSVSVAAGSTPVTGSVPYVEILTLADIMASCVNTATGSSNCTKLYGFTPSISGTAPVNTLQAFINLARNPYPSTAAMNSTTGLLSLASAFAPFQPTLTGVPNDWSLAIVYGRGVLTGEYGLGSIGMDANDTTYVALASPGTTPTAPALYAISAYGATTPTFGGDTTGVVYSIALDTVGHVWLGQNPPHYFSTSTGANLGELNYPTATMNEVAIDKQNNVWITNSYTGGTNVFEFAYSASAGTYTANYKAQISSTYMPYGIAIDPNQNVWVMSGFTSGGNIVSVLPNLGTVAAPSYTTSGTAITPVSTTTGSTYTQPWNVVIDASGNAWANTRGTASLQKITPNTTTNPMSITSTTAATATTAGENNVFDISTGNTGLAIDGAGTIFIPDGSSSTNVGVRAYVTQTNSNQVLASTIGFRGCYLATTTTTVCGTGSNSGVVVATSVAIDSSGSVWTNSGSYNTTAPYVTQGITQLIGLAAPTWPLLSAGTPGLSPGLTAVAPLP